MGSGRVSGIAVVFAPAAPMPGGRSLFDPQRGLTLGDVVNAGDDAPDATAQREGITAAACVSRRNCVEAYSTAEAEHFRFETPKRAEEHGVAVKDRFVANYIVMDFAGKDASLEEQLWAMQGLAGIWNDCEGDFADGR